MAKYIILRNSTEQAAYTSGSGAFYGHKFKVIQGGFEQMDTKTATVNIALDGTADVSYGAVRWQAQYILRLRQALDISDDVNDGTLDDLQGYYRLNNPNASPNTLITLVEHNGTEHLGYLIGDHVPQPLTTILEGSSAVFTVILRFIQRSPVA